MQIENYKYVELIMEKPQVEESEVLSAIDAELEKHIEYREVSGRPLKNWDKAVIDFTGKINGVAFPGGSGKGYGLIIGSKTFIAGFEEQLIGMSSGETKVIDVVFPENYHTAELAGKPAQFEVKLNGISEASKPELNDEFASSLGIEGVETADGFKEYIQNKLWDEKTEQNAVKFQDDVYTQILADNPVELSQAEVETGVEAEMENLRKMADGYGISVQQWLIFSGFNDENQYKASITDSVKNKLKIEKLFDLIAQQENIGANIDELDALYKEIADYYKISEASAKQSYPAEKAKRNVIHGKVSELVMQFPTYYSYAHFDVDEAQYLLGLKYIEKGETQNAKNWLTKAAEQGNAKAQSALKRL